MTDYLTTDSELEAVADAIRAKGATSALLVYPNGFVSAINAIPTGITPAGTISITSNGSTDVTNYATASVNVSPVLTLGAIRPDAEVWKEYKEDVLLVADKGITIPAYSTSIQSLVAGSQIVNESGLSADYDYFVTWRSLTYPIYNTATKAAGRQEFSASVKYVDLFEQIPVTTLDGSKSNYFQYGNDPSGRIQLGYWMSSTNFTCAAQAYGVYRGAPTSVTFNWGTIASARSLKISTEDIYIRGNANYLKQTYFEAITDIRSQYILQIWRAPKNGLNLSGWMMNQLTQNVADAISSPSHTLT